MTGGYIHRRCHCLHPGRTLYQCGQILQMSGLSVATYYRTNVLDVMSTGCYISTLLWGLNKSTIQSILYSTVNRDHERVTVHSIYDCSRKKCHRDCVGYKPRFWWNAIQECQHLEVLPPFNSLGSQTTRGGHQFFLLLPVLVSEAFPACSADDHWKQGWYRNNRKPSSKLAIEKGEDAHYMRTVKNCHPQATETRFKDSRWYIWYELSYCPVNHGWCLLWWCLFFITSEVITLR